MYATGRRHACLLAFNNRFCQRLCDSDRDGARRGKCLHNVTLYTTTIGGQSGTINVNSNSEAVANGTFTQNVNYTKVPTFTTSR